MDTPLLLIIWRRPDALNLLLDAIRPLSPASIFVASDGPSTTNPGELDLIMACRSMIDEKIDWPCVVHRLFSDRNHGCGRGPVKAINWFFEHVEQGIILEDDCIPGPDFFDYCSHLLERYKEDRRVWCISGNCFLQSCASDSASYFFSRYTLTWGWATWRDRWHQFDPLMLRWPSLRDSGLFQQLFDDRYEAEYWTEIFERTYRRDEPITWWDYQWFFAGLSRGALTATPVRNLVCNIGFGEGATHTLNAETPIHPTTPLGQLKHPDFVLRHRDADIHIYAHHFGGIRRQKLRTLQKRLSRRFYSLLAWMGLR